jgi:iron complex outermembrane receptor protein
VRLGVLATAVSLCLVGLCSAQTSHASIRRDLNVPAEGLSPALQTVGTTYDLQMLYPTAIVKDLKTQGASGSLTPEEALTKVLSGTGLSYKYLDANTVTVFETAAPPGAAAAAGQDQTDTRQGKSQEAGKKSSQDFRVAQVDQGQTSSDVSVEQHDEQTSKKKKAEELQEVVVTGTHISGLANKTVPITTINKQSIDDSGYTSTQQLIVSLPQNFNGGQQGASETGVLGIGSTASDNISNASGVNLRGLGTTSTLVLIDGHRMAPTIFGTTADVSLIPLGAIDHVDVLTDGASAIYGSDAVGGVVNFVLRRNYDGAETSLSYGAVTNGSLHEKVASQLLGTSWGSGSALLALEFDDRDSLPASERSFSTAVPEPTDLLPEYQSKSLVFHANQYVTEQAELFAEGTYTHKDSSRETTTGPSSQPFAYSTDNSNLTNAWDLVGGIRYQPVHDWRIEVSVAYSREDDATEDDFSFGILPGYVNGQPLYKTDYWLSSVDMKVDGTAFNLPGGPVSVAFGGSDRRESADFATLLAQPPGGVIPFERRVKAAFAELYIPLIGAANALPYAQALDLSVAVRRDDYSDVGSTTNPRYGISWSPLKGVALRAAYSTSFRAPNEQEESLKTVGSYIFSYPPGFFAIPGGKSEPFFLLYGASVVPLVPETSKNFTAGADFSPETLKNFKLSVGYYHIDFSNRIIQPPYDPNAFLNPGVYGSLITMLPNDAAAAAYLQSYIAKGGIFVNYSGVGSQGVRYVYNDSLINAARVRQDGLDLTVTDGWKAGANAFEANVNVAIIREILNQYTATSIPMDVSNTYGNPLRRRARGSVTWSLGEWRTTGTVNYSGPYTDNLVLPSGTISSSTTIDLNTAWSPMRVKGLSVNLSVLNALNANPPRAASAMGAIVPGLYYDVANGNPLGRFVVFGLRERW